METDYAKLPEPMPLKRAARIEYDWGDTHFEILIHKGSIRTAEWETGEEVTWLQCVGMMADAIESGQKTATMPMMIPAKYITSIKAGGAVRVSQGRPIVDVGVFPPDKPTPPNALPLDEIERALTSLYVTDRN